MRDASTFEQGDAVHTFRHGGMEGRFVRMGRLMLSVSADVARFTNMSNRTQLPNPNPAALSKSLTSFAPRE